MLAAVVMLSGCGGSKSTPSPPSATVTSVAVSGTNALTTGQTSQLTATATLSDNTIQNVTASSVWRSSNDEVASVSAAGLVTAKVTGSADITAVYQSLTGRSTIQVAPAQATILSVAITGATTLTVGQTNQFTAAATLSNGTVADVTASSTWRSTNEAVATVSSTGLVTARAAGASDISAVAENVTGARTVQVTTAPVALHADFVVTPNAGTAPAGQCAVSQVSGESNNIFRCTFSAAPSTTPTPATTTYAWQIPAGGTTFPGATVGPDFKLPCGVGSFVGTSGISTQGVTLTITAPSGSNSITKQVTFVKAGAC